MAQLIALKLVNEAGTPAAWPGTTELVQVNLVDDVDPVWIGVSADGLTNQGYPLATPLATILGIWPRVYQGIQVVISGQTNLYNNGQLDYERRVAACCISPQSETSPSPGESPAPQSIQMMFAFSSSQLEGCEAAQTPYYVSADADPNNMTGEGIFLDPELTEPALENGPYVIVNGIVYNYGEEDPANVVGSLIGVCSEFASMRFDVNYGSPGQTLDFRLIFAPDPQQFFVDWGDGSPLEEFNGEDVSPEHLYADAGEYEVRVHIVLGGNLLLNIEMLNHPLTYFGFHPEFGGSLSMQTLHVQNCGLTDATLDVASFNTANINTVILADNQLTAAILPLLTDFITTLNLSNNNLGDVVLNEGPEQLAILFANNAGVDSFDGSDFLTSSLSALALANNGLETFDIAGLALNTLTDLNLSGNSIPSAEVDAILEALDTAGNTDGLVNLSGQTPAAPPGAGGLTAQSNLEGKNWTVTVDS